jgi:hypothetical protein
MTASTRSAYPASVAELIPLARAYAAELGQVPSRNQVMRRFKVGAPKATTILAALADPTAETESRVEPETPDTGDAGRVRSLRPVRVTETGAETTSPEPAEQSAGPVEPSDESSGDRSPSRDTPQVTPVADPDTKNTTTPARRQWPLVLLALPAFVAIWGGWVGLGRMTGFGPIQLLPGIWDELIVNSAITLPIGVEAYAAFAMSVWLSGKTRSARTRRFAMWSALGSLGLGMAGQVAYHLMSAAGITVAPWWITTFVACLPVVVLGCGAALLHMMHEEDKH